MNIYRVEFCLNGEPNKWYQTGNLDQLYDASNIAFKLSKLDTCTYRVRQLEGNKVLGLYTNGEVIQDDSGTFQVGQKIV